jgi:TM2 domain-containing membrane protein YozV
MNINLQNRLILFQNQIANVNDSNQILLLKNRYKNNTWWLSIIITGLWQMCNGQFGFGICLLLFGWILFGLGGWVIGIITAYNQCDEYNNQLEIIAYKRINEIKSMGHNEDSTEHYRDSGEYNEKSTEHYEYSVKPSEEQIPFQCVNCGSKSITLINGIPTCEYCGTKYPQKRE